MATSIVFNGTTYSIPSVGDSGYGDQLSAYFIAIASSALQKSGGNFTLTSTVDFGATAGLKALYWATRSSNPSATGVIRLSNNEGIGFRNQANSADLLLKVNASNVLEFNGNPITSLALGAADTVLRMNSGGTATEYAKIVNANVDAAAAIAYSKLSLSNSIVNADIASAAAIAYSKLNLSGSIVNVDVSASAAIAHSKMAALTASRVMVTDGSGVASASSVTSTTLGYLDATSSIQTQLDVKQPLDSDLTALAGLSSTGIVARTGSGTAAARTVTAGSSKVSVTNGDGVSGNPTIDVTEANLTLTSIGGTLSIAKGGTGQTSQTAAFDALAPTTTKGDLIVSNGTDNIRLAVGSDGQVLTAASGQASGLSWTSPLTNPMDSEGDLIIGGASGAATKLDAGTSGHLLMAKGAAAPEWTSTFTTGKVIDGTVDENQLRIQAHSTQTSDIFVVENSAGTDHLRVKGDGNVILAQKLGIGQASPDVALDIEGGSTAACTIEMNNTAAARKWGIQSRDDGAFHINDETAGGNRLKLGTSGQVYFPGVGTTGGAANAFLDNSVSNQLLRSTSSVRYKENIRDIEIDTSKIYNLRPVTFKSKALGDNGQEFFGLVAEEVYQAVPELAVCVPERCVVEGSTSETLIPDGVAYDRLAVLLLAEIKKLRDRIEQLEAKG